MDLDFIKNSIVKKIVGNDNSKEHVGAGFLHKNVINDNINLVSPYYVLVYVLRGTGRFIDNTGKRFKLKPGNFFQRIPGQIHSNIIDKDSNWLEGFIDIEPGLFEVLKNMNFLNNLKII